MSINLLAIEIENIPLTSLMEVNFCFVLKLLFWNQLRYNLLLLKAKYIWIALLYRTPVYDDESMKR